MEMAPHNIVTPVVNEVSRAIALEAPQTEVRGEAQTSRVARLRTRPLGGVSIDMDTLADYAGGYGFSYTTKPDPVYTVGLVRFLDVLAKHRVKATIFAVGRDALVPEHAEVLRRAVAEGHELANHTMTHPRKLASLDQKTLQREIGEAHDILSNLRGSPVIGFRAPCYDVNRAVLEILQQLQYRYDSSVHPSIIGPVIDFVVLAKSKFRKWEMRPGTYMHLLAPLEPYRPSKRFYWRKDRLGSLIELPLTAMPWSRLPFYGTFTQMTGMNLFRRSLNWLRRSGNSLNFHYHAVELIDMKDKGVDERFAVHPGLTRSAQTKCEEVGEMLSRFNSIYEMVTLDRMATTYLVNAP